MTRNDRLARILGLMRDGRQHRARDIALRLGVSERTVYRDMDLLAAAGVPVAGIRGAGYRLADLVPLPPLVLTPAELEALNLGIAIVAELPDPDLRAAALSLADRIDAALPAETPDQAEAWKLADYPLADAARGFAHMATLRAAIRGRQKLRVTARDRRGARAAATLRPLRLEHLGRVWILTAWDETAGAFAELRLDLIEQARALPELFVDEPGKRLADFRPGSLPRPEASPAPSGQ